MHTGFTLVILAAGAGRRYGGPKQLAPIGPSGETLLEYAAFDAWRAGFDRVVLVVRARAEAAFRDRLDAGMARRVPVVYAHQEPGDLPAGLGPPAGRTRPWGTVHAVLAAAPQLQGPFAVVNADDFYGAGSYAALAGFLDRAGRGRAAAVGYRVAETLSDSGPVARAVLETGADGRLRRIVEIREVWSEAGRVVCRDREGRRQPMAGEQLISMNMWGFEPRLLAELRRGFARFLARHRDEPEAEALLPDMIQSLIRRGRLGVDVLPAGGVWCGLTYRQDHERVRAFIASLAEKGRYPENLWAGRLG